MNYFVTLVETVNRCCVVDVDADSESDAKAKAVDMWNHEEINYSDMEELESEVTEVYVKPHTTKVSYFPS